MRCPLSIGINEYGTRGVFCPGIILGAENANEKYLYDFRNVEVFVVVVIAAKYRTLEGQVQMTLGPLAASFSPGDTGTKNKDVENIFVLSMSVYLEWQKKKSFR